MASSSQLPLVHHYELGDRVQLQVKVSGSAKTRNAKVEFQIKNSSKLWILHWGGIYRGQTNWVLLNDRPAGTKVYHQTALQTPFLKSGDVYSITIEIRDPNIQAIEYILRDETHGTWLKLNQRNFRVGIPEDVPIGSHPSIPKDLVEHKAYLLWESKGRPRNSPQQQQKDYDESLEELQRQLARGLSLDQLRSSFQASGSKRIVEIKEQPALSRSSAPSFQASGSKRIVEIKELPALSSSSPPYIWNKRHDVGQWLHRRSKCQARSAKPLVSSLMDRVQKSMGGDSVILQQSFYVGSHEIAVIFRSDGHLLVAVNIRGSIVLHWGVSKSSLGEWLAPPPQILPERSKMVDGACQTYFNDMTTGEGFFQFVDINMQRMDFVGMQFILWSGGSWIKNNGTNFSVGLRASSLKSRKGEDEGTRIVKWLLDEISQREKDAERSLMHRFNIATELTECCKSEGELGLIGILVWLRFMACRQLTWNKNYNVKPREISAAQDKFTNLLQRIYSSQPNDREIVRLMMSMIGRGGEGDVGQRIRDEILVLQRNNDCKGGMMEEWHQKLHNNSSPDDIIICQALLDYVRGGYKIDVYWRTLNAHGLTKNILRSYDRPIVSEPQLRIEAKEGLLRDLTSYLKTLKAVHSGTDVESAIETCLGLFSKGHGFVNAGHVNSSASLPSRLQEYLKFVKLHLEDKNIGPLMEKLLESRIELRPILLTSHGVLKDLIFLDLALDSAVRSTMERGFTELNDTHYQGIMSFISLLLENLCLSTVDNEDLIYCTKDWYRVCETHKPNDPQWALQAKAVIDRVRLALSDKSQYYHQMIQPSAEYLGDLLHVERWAIDIFTEELIRAGSAASLSILVNRLDPLLRKIANLGSWQVISPAEVCGFVTVVNELTTVQNSVYKKPTVIIANRIGGEEEIPEGVVALLTPDMPDVLSHVSVRARNSKVCFATCFDQNILKNLKSKEGKAISIKLRSASLLISEISSLELSLGNYVPTAIPRGTTLMRKTFCGKYAVAVEEFTSEMVGAKSRNIQYLRGRVPSRVKIPTSVAIPFGVFETVLASGVNKELSSKVSSFIKIVNGGDLSKLRAIQQTILQMEAPMQLISELKSTMKNSRIPWPGDESEEKWKQGWQAIKKVWASKWNERAYISCRKANLNHDHLCMAVLVQEVISADYAFVIHTKNPISSDPSEIYTEIVRGLGESLVGAYPGRAMSFTVKKSDLKSPVIVGYPSKQTGLFIKKSLIFRSDSNGEDLEGYAGAGLYDSIIMDQEEKRVLDYSLDRLLVDKGFQRSIFSKIAEVGKTIEGLYRSAQDIEGVVKDGEIYVVQTRPQM